MFSNAILSSLFLLIPPSKNYLFFIFFLQIWHFQRHLQLDGHVTCTAATSHGQLGDRVPFGPMTSKTTNRSSVKQNGKDGSNQTYSVWFGSLEKHLGPKKQNQNMFDLVLLLYTFGHKNKHMYQKNKWRWPWPVWKTITREIFPYLKGSYHILVLWPLGFGIKHIASIPERQGLNTYGEPKGITLKNLYQSLRNVHPKCIYVDISFPVLWIKRMTFSRKHIQSSLKQTQITSHCALRHWTWLQSSRCLKSLKGWQYLELYLHMDVSKNRGIPKSSILIGFSIINHPFWGPTPIFGNTHIFVVKFSGGHWKSLNSCCWFFNPTSERHQFLLLQQQAQGVAGHTSKPQGKNHVRPEGSSSEAWIAGQEWYAMESEDATMVFYANMSVWKVFGCDLIFKIR